MPKIIKKILFNQKDTINRLTNDLIDNGLMELKRVNELVLCKINQTQSLILCENKKYEKIKQLIGQQPDALTEMKNLFVGFMWLIPLQEEKHQVAKVFLHEKYRSQGIGMMMYQEALRNTDLYSDDRQTLQAQKIWKKLFQSSNVVVQGYEHNNDKFLNLVFVGDEIKAQNNRSTNTENILYRACIKKSHR